MVGENRDWAKVRSGTAQGDNLKTPRHAKYPHHAVPQGGGFCSKAATVLAWSRLYRFKANLEGGSSPLGEGRVGVFPEAQNTCNQSKPRSQGSRKMIRACVPRLGSQISCAEARTIFRLHLPVAGDACRGWYPFRPNEGSGIA